MLWSRIFLPVKYGIRHQEDSWILFGPILLAPANAARFQHAGRKFGKLEDIGLHLQICELNTLVAGMILYYGYLTGKELSLAEFLEYNKEEFPSVQKIHEQLGRDLFAHQEQAGIHNPYEQERREQDAIRHGDVAALNRSISETYEGKIGQLAKDPLRHHKNVAIGNITLASRTAVEAGVSVEKSFTMADSMIQQIEEIDNVTEVEAFKRMAQRMYADVVAEELQANEGGYKNPLIAAVKDYIFQHFHDSIQITDIAKYLKVNPDYLSHLFKEQEHITIKRYILQEKSAEAGICYSIRITVFRKSVSIWASALRAISVRCFRRSQGRHRGIIRSSLPIGRNGRFSKIKLRIMQNS